MAGSDQSANLSGMLSGISDTLGQMGESYRNEYKDLMKSASMPRGDMNDPAHLRQLAQWAAAHGDTESAQRYMQQASKLEAEVKDTQAIQGMMGQQQAGLEFAQQGDVENLKRVRGELNKTMMTPGISSNVLAGAQRSLSALNQAMPGAMEQRTKNRNRDHKKTTQNA